MSDAPLRVERDDEGIALLTLDRPDARNALDDQLAEALQTALDDGADDPATRALIVTGAGEAFCAGGDLARFGRKWTPSGFRRHSHRLTSLVAGIECDVVSAARTRARLALQRSPEAYAAVKRLLALAADASLEAGLTAEALAQTSLIATPEHRDAVVRARERRTGA